METVLDSKDLVGAVQAAKALEERIQFNAEAAEGLYLKVRGRGRTSGLRLGINVRLL